MDLGLSRTNSWLNYRVGEISTTNKLTAVEAANGDLAKVKLHFADEHHAQHDWTTEPTVSLDKLIDDRVRELRDRHAYLCLWYSGGYDSQTILDSFVRTNTRLDEILIYNRQWFDHELNIEDSMAYQHAHWIQKKYQSWLKIRVIQYDAQAIFDFYHHYGNDWIYHDRGSFPGFTKQNRANTAQWQKDFRDLGRQIGRLDINGAEKPRVNLIDGRWYSQMPDTAIYYYLDCPYELFYMSPEATKIYIKQCWMAIRWMEQHPAVSHAWVHDVQSNALGPEIYAQWNYACGRSRVYDKISAGGLYKHLVSGGIAAPEGRKLVAVSQTQHLEIYRHWQRGLNYIETRFSNCWNPIRGFDTVMSRPIYIKDQEVLL